MGMPHFEQDQPLEPAALRKLYKESILYVRVVIMPGGGQAVHAHMSGDRALTGLSVYRCLACEKRACEVCITGAGKGCRHIAIFVETTALGKAFRAVLGEEDPPDPGEEPRDQPMEMRLGYQADDGGRAAAGFSGRSNDGLIPAIAICARLGYREVREAMTALMKANGYTLTGGPTALRRRQEQQRGGWQGGRLTRKEVEEQLLTHFGFKRVNLPAGPRPTYLEAFDTYGNCIVESGRIRCALVGGELRDIEDSRIVRQYDSPRVNGTFGARRVSERKAQRVWVRGESQTGDP